MIKKINVYVITISTFLFWQLYGFIEKYFAIIEDLYFFKALIASIFSYTSYKAFIFITVFLGNRIDIIKRIILGNEYLNGTWIGYYQGVKGDIRYFIEIIEQDIDSIVIRGNTFYDNLELYSCWNSEAVNINGKTGTLTYTYTYFIFGKDSVDDGLGMAKSSFIRNNSREQPKAMNGFSTDLKFGEKITSYEEKITYNMTVDELKIKAKELYIKRANGIYLPEEYHYHIKKNKQLE